MSWSLTHLNYREHFQAVFVLFDVSISWLGSPSRFQPVVEYNTPPNPAAAASCESEIDYRFADSFI
jgi:hypothetical protein